MYKKKKKNFKTYHKSGNGRRSYTDNTKYDYQGKPEEEGKNVKTYLSEKSLRNLPHSSYSMVSDPYAAANNPSAPYPILNVFNKSFGGNYAGSDNLDGGNVQQYASSEFSKMLKAFDVARLQVSINYRYLPIKPLTVPATANYAGKQLVNEVIKSISEAMSVLQTTTYTKMTIYNFAVETDLPMGSATTTNIANGETAINAYTDRSAVFYALSIYYQIFWQEILNTLKWHSSFRLKQGTAIRNAWNREVPMLNAFFGLMNKKAFLSLLDSINLSFEGEWIDTDWATQAAMINYAPSRRSNSMLDPVKEVQTRYNHPTKFKIYYLNESTGKIASIDDSAFFDDSSLKVGDVSFWSAIEQLNDLLSLEATTLFARTNNYTGQASTDNARYNQIKGLFDNIIIAINTFKPKWSDYREALDTLSRAGIINWTKGFRPQTEPSTDAPLFNNLLVNDIYSLILGGAARLTFDSSTKRWRTSALWNMYSGIPEFAIKSGGSFLTFSFKELVSSGDVDANVNYLPILFNVETVGTDRVKCVLVSRDGKEVSITANDEVINTNYALSRLIPLTSQNSFVLRVPTLTVTTTVNTWLGTDTNKAIYEAFIIRCLTDLVGYCKTKNTASDSFRYHIDPDYIAVYDVEIEDITNMAITYSRANSPIKGTSSGEGLLGFFGLASKNKKK